MSWWQIVVETRSNYCTNLCVWFVLFSWITTAQQILIFVLPNNYLTPSVTVFCSIPVRLPGKFCFFSAFFFLFFLRRGLVKFVSLLLSLEGLRKTTKVSNDGSRSLSRDSYPVSPRYKAQLLETKPWRSVVRFWSPFACSCTWTVRLPVALLRRLSRKQRTSWDNSL